MSNAVKKLVEFEEKLEAGLPIFGKIARQVSSSLILAVKDEMSVKELEPVRFEECPTHTSSVPQLPANRR